VDADDGKGETMRATLRILAVVFATFAAAASAQPVTWSTYTIPETGTVVDFPASVFTKEIESMDGYGQRFQTADGRATIAITADRNVSNDTPAAFLAKRNPPPNIQYKRVTSRFFAVSSYRGDKVWYNRCNFSGDVVHCVLINYPAKEERDWDDIVTRISLSLKAR
jgi:hypothetical protein